jgi:hypothetical protein
MHSSDSPPDTLAHPHAVPPIGQLMCRVYAGDEDAFVVLVDEVTPQWAPYRRWGRSAATTEDLLQELWMTLWRELRCHPPIALQTRCCEGEDGV